ncbi:putative pinoresinol-lariciresinol reductase [Lachnellula suecica]|uniref:Putative pinoresinol-lariciresinol reductase n=1 Tax=Lachnellula suecica TaxID=602035 RepID=A0A8T9C694_9HELO|nr:putative pinoresinol-lariciresinol reductase [Lachnellula suecica]
MSAIKKVAVIGASGNVGSPVATALLASGFEVTAITRTSSTATFPAGVTVAKVDLTSLSALTEAFTGQDAVVSTIATEALDAQKVLIDAAVAAKVTRFIPSEFGINTREVAGTKIGALLGAKVANVDYLIELAAKHEWFSWTGISTGLFFDWNLVTPLFGLNLAAKRATIFDSGNEPYSTSSLSFIGKIVAAALTNASVTKNRYISVSGFTTTQNEVLKAVEEVTGAKFEVTSTKTAEVEKVADEKMAKGDYSAFIEYLVQYLMADGKGSAVKGNKEALAELGLEEEDMKALVKKIVGGS